jgi:hypothetical protein
MAARLCGERESGGEQMNGRGGFQGVFRALYAEVGLVYGAPGAETIGRHGRLSGVALCTGFRGEVTGGDGWVVWSERAEFQNRGEGNGRRRGRLSRLGCGAWGALRHTLDTVHGRVRHESSGRVSAREHIRRSRRPLALPSASRAGPGQGL